MTAAWDIYFEEMLPLKQGYALWEADPLEQYPLVRVGDAGLIKEGKFEPCWNMWDDQPEPPTRLSRFQATTPIGSRSMKTQSFTVGLEGDQPLTSAGGSVTCNFGSNRGAVLYLKDRFALKHDLKPQPAKELKDYVLNNLDEVLGACHIQHGHNDRDELKDFVVITGVTMTGDWDAAVCSGSTRGGEIDISAGMPSVVLAKTSLAIQHTSEQTVRESGGHYHSDGRRNQAEGCCEDKKNQCIFIRALKLKRKHLFSKEYKFVSKMKGAADPKDPDCGENDDDFLNLPVALSPGNESDGSMVMESFPSNEKPPNTYDAMFHFIFENSDAELAMIQDSDVIRWIDCHGDYEQLLPVMTNPIHKLGYLRESQSKALIVSIRYRGQTADQQHLEILDDHQRAYEFKDLLTDQYGYEDDDIIMLLEGVGEKSPNKANIIEELTSLTSFAGSGDRFVFYFSGHAGQDYGGSDDSGEDGRTEFIWPIDHATNGVLLESELHGLITGPLQNINCRLTAVFDSYLSGSLEFTHRDVSPVGHLQDDFGDAAVESYQSSFGADDPTDNADTSRFASLSRELPSRFQVMRGKLGLRENYISTSFQQWTEEEEQDGGFPPSTSQIEPNTGHETGVVRFSRRSIIRASILARLDGQGDEAEKQDSATAEGAELHQEEVIQAIIETRARIAAAPQQPEAMSTLTIEYLDLGLEKAFTVIAFDQGMLQLTKRMATFTDFLLERTWLLQDTQSELLKRKQHTLLLLVFDVDAFFDRCIRLHQEELNDMITTEAKNKEDESNLKRAEEFEQKAISLHTELRQVKPSHIREDPRVSLLEQDNTYRPEYEKNSKAIITSWSVSVPKEAYWKGNMSSGLNRSMIDFLNNNPHPTYRTLLEGLTGSLPGVTHETEQDKNDNILQHVLSDRAQLASLKPLNIDAEFTL